MLTEASPAFAASKEIEQALWKPCFYKRIEDFRRRIRKYASASSSDRSVREHFARVSTEFQQFLSESSAFYDHLRESYSKWLLNNRVSRIASAATNAPSFASTTPATPDPTTAGSIARCRQSLHRCFIFLGDLARYRELHSQKAKKNFAAAESFYHKALALIPENGNPHNQLAVLATYVEAETVAVYRYCRSLLIAQPFATAEENLALLFERSRQRPLAAPSSTALTGASPSKEKSAFLKSFLHRLTRMHGILFSIATRPSGAGSNNVGGYGSTSSANSPVYPRDMEAILFKDLNALLRAGVMGDALLLKVVVTNVFCLVRSMRGNASAKEDSFRLSTLTISSVIEYLLEELEKKTIAGGNAEHPNSLRLLGPVSVFCDFMRLNPKVLDVLEATLSRPASPPDAYPSTRFAKGFLESLAALLNHAKLKEVYSPLVTLRDDQQEPFREQQLVLKENIELRGFSPFASLLESASASSKWSEDLAVNGGSQNGNVPALAESDAVKIRAWNLFHFGKFLCDEYEGNPLLYLYQGTFSTSPSVGGGSSNGFLQAVSGTRDKNPSVSQVPSFSLGLFGLQGSSETQKASHGAVTKHQPDEDDEFDDEVIVFQPSPALNPVSTASGSSALGGDVNTRIGGLSSPFADLSAAGPFSLGTPSSQTAQDPKRSSFSDSFGSFTSGSIGSTLGYPNFHTFSDFGSFSGQGLLSGWGNNDTSMNSNTLGKPPSVPKVDSFGLGNRGGNQFAPLMDLAAVERESALYQQEESSLSAFFGSSQRSSSSGGGNLDLSSSRTSPRPPPPPGFGNAPLGVQPSLHERRDDGVTVNHAQQQPQFYTRNPFINP